MTKRASAEHHAVAETVPFGDRDVSAADKAGLVGGVFSRVAPRYDLMNDLMSGGLHRAWKRALVAELGAPRRPGARLLDLAGGTGDIAARVLDRHGRDAGWAVTVCDINPDMLAAGRERAWNRGDVRAPDWLCGDAEALPVGAATFDACTMAFGIRNVTRIEDALREIARVLKPGGRFLCLEFSPSVLPVLRAAYDRFSYQVIPRLGALVADDRDAYVYLVDSIRRFPNVETFTGMIAAAGFAGVRARRFAGGIAVLHGAWRV